MKSIVVIGGGLVGAACAVRLQAAGVQTTLVDPGDMRRGASYGNAGHIGSEQVTPWSAWSNVWRAPLSSFALGGPLDFRWSDAPLWGAWAMRFLAACAPARYVQGQAALTALLQDSMPAWLRLADFLEQPGLVKPHGHVTAWMSPAKADVAIAAMAKTAWGATTYREMTAPELARYENVLDRAPCAAVTFSGTGQVSDPQTVRDKMLAVLSERGGEILTDTATRIDSDGRVTLGSGRVHAGEAVLVAAGPWSRRLMEGLGVVTPLIGERGYHLQSAETNWPFDLPTTVFEENFVVLSRFTSGLRATSFLEFGSPDAPADPRKWALLRNRLSDLGVKFSDNPGRWFGSRPTLPDYLPAIGRLERAPNVLYAFGHQHLGLTMAPITSELVRAIATEKAPSVDVAPYRIERFS